MILQLTYLQKTVDIEIKESWRSSVASSHVRPWMCLPREPCTMTLLASSVVDEYTKKVTWMV